MKEATERINHRLRAEGTGEVDYFDITSNQDGAFEEYIDGQRYRGLWVTEPQRSNLRLDRQRGTFLLSAGFQRITDEIAELPPESVVKLEFPAGLARAVTSMLSSMGIDHRTLFGDIDGLAKDIRAEMIEQISKIPSGHPDRGAPTF